MPRRAKATRTTRRLVALVMVLGAVVAAALLWRGPPRNPKAKAMQAAERLLPQLLALEARETQAATVNWGPELRAQLCGQVFERLWDDVHQASNQLDVLANLDFLELLLPQLNPASELGLGIRFHAPHPTPTEPAGSTPAGLDRDGWRTWLEEERTARWTLTQLEFRHNRFDVDGQGRPERSEFGFRAHAIRSHPEERAALEGDLVVEWALSASPEAAPAIRRLDARRITLKRRAGPPGFRQVLHAVVPPPERSHFVDPLVLRDLDEDGRPEIILASANRVFEWEPAGRFDHRELCVEPPGLLFTAVIGEFDGRPGEDLLVVKFEGLFLGTAMPDGHFESPRREAWAAPQRIRYGQVLTCGDVDGDGDLDVWLGQYKNPYDGGQMPTPYYNALDGHPSYLLLNNGQGRFTDATEASGLGAKRHRRTYAGSLVDVDHDGDLDLVVVSDFAGVDLYLNDGHGRFADVTRERIAAPSGFGMAHAVADFNRDGRLDLFVTGMHCPTASRLVHLGLSRRERPDYLAMAPAMIAGNKLLLAQEDGRFRDLAAPSGVARTGWSWGCVATDFDNDGWPDLAIVNGHETRASVQDYESEFWLHDLYVANAKESPVVATYFASKFHRLRAGAGWSYGGWEQNRLFLNRGSRGFVEVAHLLGVAVGEDSRNLVADDLDGDGRVDLVLTTFEVWPERRQTVQVFRNELPETGHWLGVRFAKEVSAGTAVGATVTVQLADGSRIARPLITGDSHRGQSGTTLHFGLGAGADVERVEVKWRGGQQSEMVRPPVDCVIVFPPARD